MKVILCPASARGFTSKGETVVLKKLKNRFWRIPMIYVISAMIAFSGVAADHRWYSLVVIFGLMSLVVTIATVTDGFDQLNTGCGSAFIKKGG